MKFLPLVLIIAISAGCRERVLTREVYSPWPNLIINKIDTTKIGKTYVNFITKR